MVSVVESARHLMVCGFESASFVPGSSAMFVKKGFCLLPSLPNFDVQVL